MRKSPAAVIVSWEVEFRGLTSGQRCKHPPRPRVLVFPSPAKQENRFPVGRPKSAKSRPIRTEPARRAPQQEDDIGLGCPDIIVEEQDLLSVWRQFWIGATLGEQLRFTAGERGNRVNATTIALRTKNDLGVVRREIGRSVIVPAP